ncbi:MAG: hypothetical protein R3257_02795, partial [bacterium]|nr:hypothetical protein [bacterium]
MSVLSFQPSQGRLNEVPASETQESPLYSNPLEPSSPAAWEEWASQFLDHVLDPSALGSMLGASWTYRAARFFLAARGMNALAASTLAFGAEATGFPLYGRLINGGLGRPNDWSAAALERDVQSSFLVLGGLKLFGKAAQSSVQWWRHSRVLRGTWGDRGMETALPLAGMYLGILSGHWGEQRLGIRPHHPQENLAMESLATLSHFVAAGRILGQVATPQMRSLEFTLNRPPAAKGRLPFFPQPLLAGAGVFGASRPKRPMLPWVFMAEKGNGNGNGNGGRERRGSTVRTKGKEITFEEARIRVILRTIGQRYEEGRAGDVEAKKLLTQMDDLSFLEVMAPSHPEALRALGKLMAMDNISAGSAIRRLAKKHPEALELLAELATENVPGALTSLEMVAHENPQVLEVLKRLAVAERPGALESFLRVAQNHEGGLRALEEMFWRYGEMESYLLLIRLGQDGGIRSHQVLTNLLTRTLE